MDRCVLAWARRVKARDAHAHAGRRPLPPLWLFTDAERLPDPRPIVACLPRRLCGVVLRPGPARNPNVDLFARDLARLCRERGLPLAVAGDWRLAARLGAGLHLRGGRRPGVAPRWLRFLTASAHDPVELRRAARCRSALVFISPVFATRSHLGAPGLGPGAWSRLARAVPGRAGALGGIAGRLVRRLPPACRAVGGIDLFLVR